MKDQNCPSCEHPLALHRVWAEQQRVHCEQQVDEGASYFVDCWSCELTPDELLVLWPEAPVE